MSKNEEKLSSTKYWIETTKSNFGTIVKDLDKDGSGEIEPEEFTKLIRNILTALVEN